MSNEVKNTLARFKKLEADIAVVKTVNTRLEVLGKRPVFPTRHSGDC